jgi:uncharacterized protein
VTALVEIFHGIIQNRVIITALVGWFIAQSLKFVTVLIDKKRIDFKYFVSTGGMPSSHSAFVMSLAVAVGFDSGWDSALFGLAMAFAIVVMYDASGVRQAAGRQAEVLNIIVEDMFKTHKIAEKRLRELLGHTPIEVMAGAALGILVGLAMQSFLS